MDMNHPQRQQQPRAHAVQNVETGKRAKFKNYKRKHFVEKLHNGHPFIIHSSHLQTQHR